ncbi:MAG: two-component system, OmpR family, response regulator RegX3 [Actinomycetota bacterium]|jgi:two-component system response regulator RegX3|nr:two-component system, OmpR family, response regulator RegX3 [Actinomycetota bacterium]
MSHILLIEDEPGIAEPLGYQLEKAGYSVTWSVDGREGLELFLKDGADLVLLDLMLPGMSGEDVCREIRRTSNVPVIMLTAKDEEVDKIVGLEIGADDYVTKPFSTRELIARIKAVLRRGTTPAQTDDVFVAGEIRLDPDRHELTVGGEQVHLPKKEFDLLELLMENTGRVVTRETLIDRVWGSDYFGDMRTLDVHIKRLRAKTESDPADPKHLLTVRGVGYKFVG